MQTLLDEKVDTDSVDYVCSQLYDRYGLQFKKKDVQRVLKKELNMGYGKIHEIAPHTNSEKNLVMRQRFSIELLSILKKKTHVICIDETWINQTDFRRRKWQVRGRPSSVPKMQVAPRISLILALDTLGSVYMSLVQSNSNSKIMEIYIAQQVQVLDSERPGWRKNTIWIWDNAVRTESL